MCCAVDCVCEEDDDCVCSVHKEMPVETMKETLAAAEMLILLQSERFRGCRPIHRHCLFCSLRREREDQQKHSSLKKNSKERERKREK